MPSFFLSTTLPLASVISEPNIYDWKDLLLVNTEAPAPTSAPIKGPPRGRTVLNKAPNVPPLASSGRFFLIVLSAVSIAFLESIPKAASMN